MPPSFWDEVATARGPAHRARTICLPTVSHHRHIDFLALSHTLWWRRGTATNRVPGDPGPVFSDGCTSDCSALGDCIGAGDWGHICQQNSFHGLGARVSCVELYGRFRTHHAGHRHLSCIAAAVRYIGSFAQPRTAFGGGLSIGPADWHIAPGTARTFSVRSTCWLGLGRQCCRVCPVVPFNDQLAQRICSGRYSCCMDHTDAEQHGTLAKPCADHTPGIATVGSTRTPFAGCHAGTVT